MVLQSVYVTKVETLTPIGPQQCYQAINPDPSSVPHGSMLAEQTKAGRSCVIFLLKSGRVRAASVTGCPCLKSQHDSGWDAIGLWSNGENPALSFPLRGDRLTQQLRNIQPSLATNKKVRKKAYHAFHCVDF